MSARRVWVVGAGKRVRETALPALASLAGSVEIAGVFARTSRYLDAAGRRFAVRALADALPAEFQAGDVVYVAVGKDSVPAVLERLAKKLHCERLELLIDTPVIKLKHLRHAHLFDGWKRATVAEDVAYLPWIETVRAAAGDVRVATFDRSAYAYHGLAQAKALCGGTRVARARRRKTGGVVRREIELVNGARAVVIEPRDYARGRVLVEGSRGLVADRVEPGENAVLLEVVLEDGRCVGFRAGDVVTRLSRAEIELLAPREAADDAGPDAATSGVAPPAALDTTRPKAEPSTSAPRDSEARGAATRKSATWDAAPLAPSAVATKLADPPEATVIARMESMKRVAFRRLVEDVVAGRGYPLADGLDDMAADWFLERFGGWRAGGLRDLRNPSARKLWSGIGRLAR